jgi:hypothetical protein
VTWHSIKEYLKYRRKAYSRHGVHSPFVYGFIENALRGKADPASSLNKLVLVTSAHSKTINRMIGYFNCRNILWLTNRNGDKETYLSITPGSDDNMQISSRRFDYDARAEYPSPDMLLIDLEDPSDWEVAFDKYRELLMPESVVLVNSIHESRYHTAAWDRLKASEQAKLSIDIFRVGLLFFREEFAEKQQFILKYPG